VPRGPGLLIIGLMGAVRRRASVTVLAGYRLVARGRGKLFSLLVAEGFASFGARSVLQPPIRLAGEGRMAIGSDVFVGAGSWLQVIERRHDDVALEIGDGTSIAGNCVLSAASSVRLGRKVLVARGVYVSDHAHRHDDPDIPILDQGIARVAPVLIDDGAWLGENVVVGPGVRVGRGAVIGANAVVLEDVPDHAVAVGVPARVVRTLGQRVEERR
jgi:acetyltransferase-like isoleucine patch superfamily enzyme